MSAATVTSKVEQLRERLREAQRTAAPVARKAEELEPQLAEAERQLKNARTQLDAALRTEILTGRKSNTTALEQQIASLQNRHRIVEGLVGDARAAADAAYRPIVALQAQIEDEEAAEKLCELNAAVSTAHAVLAVARQNFDRAEEEYRRLQAQLSAVHSRRMVSAHERSRLPPGQAPHEPHPNADAGPRNPWSPNTP